MTEIPVTQPLRRRLNHAMHELRRPLQVLALQLGSRADFGAITAALNELDRIVNPSASPQRPRTRQLALMVAIQNVVLNSLEHGSGEVRITACPDDGTVVVRNRVPPSVPAPATAHRGHGLAIARKAVSELGGRIDFAIERGEAVASLQLATAEPPTGRH